MTYLILRRNNKGYHFRSFTFVASVAAKDAVSAMEQFCGCSCHGDFVAVSKSWSGLSRYPVYGLNLNYA